MLRMFSSPSTKHPLADSALVAATLGERSERREHHPFRIRHITWAAQPAALNHPRVSSGPTAALRSGGPRLPSPMSAKAAQ